MEFMAHWPILDKQYLKKKVCNKKTNDQMHSRNTQTGPNSNLEWQHNDHPGRIIFKGLVKPAKVFGTWGKRTKHAGFGYLVTKFISSDTRHVTAVHQKASLSILCGGKF